MFRVSNLLLVSTRSNGTPNLTPQVAALKTISVCYFFYATYSVNILDAREVLDSGTVRLRMQTLFDLMVVVSGFLTHYNNGVRPMGSMKDYVTYMVRRLGVVWPCYFVAWAGLAFLYAPRPGMVTFSTYTHMPMEEFARHAALSFFMLQSWLNWELIDPNTAPTAFEHKTGTP